MITDDRNRGAFVEITGKMCEQYCKSNHTEGKQVAYSKELNRTATVYWQTNNSRYPYFNIVMDGGKPIML